MKKKIALIGLILYIVSTGCISVHHPEMTKKVTLPESEDSTESLYANDELVRVINPCNLQTSHSKSMMVLGKGSGFFILPNGIIRTAQHVIEGKCVFFLAITSKEEIYLAEKISENDWWDIASLRITSEVIIADDAKKFFSKTSSYAENLKKINLRVNSVHQEEEFISDFFINGSELTINIGTKPVEKRDFPIVKRDLKKYPPGTEVYIEGYAGGEHPLRLRGVLEDGAYNIQWNDWDMKLLMWWKTFWGTDMGSFLQKEKFQEELAYHVQVQVPMGVFPGFSGGVVTVNNRVIATSIRVMEREGKVWLLAIPEK